MLAYSQNLYEIFFLLANGLAFIFRGIRNSMDKSITLTYWFVMNKIPLSMLSNSASFEKLGVPLKASLKFKSNLREADNIFFWPQCFRTTHPSSVRLKALSTVCHFPISGIWPSLSLPLPLCSSLSLVYLPSLPPSLSFHLNRCLT